MEGEYLIVQSGSRPSDLVEELDRLATSKFDQFITVKTSLNPIAYNLCAKLVKYLVAFFIIRAGIK